MAYIHDFSSYTTVTDAVKMWQQGSQPIDGAYTRGWNGYQDDQKFSVHKQLILNTPGKNGSILGSSFMWLSYDAGFKAGDLQAESFWKTFSAGGQWWALPPAVDVERRRFLANGAWQFVPFPPVNVFGDHLHKAVDYLTNKLGRRPAFYSNVDVILNYLYPYITSAAGAWLLECPLWIAHWRAAVPFQGYKPNPWPEQLWYIHQIAGDIKDWPGVDDVDLNRFNGDRAGMKAWGKDPSWKPGTVVVEPPPVPEPEPPTTNIETRLAAVERDLANIQRAGSMTVVINHAAG